MGIPALATILRYVRPRRKATPDEGRRAFLRGLAGTAAVVALVGRPKEAFAAAPVLASTTIYRGALTKATHAYVSMADLMLQNGGVDVTSWNILQTGGTPGHWSTPINGDSPSPTTAGASVQLNGGPYTFSVTATNADGVSASAVLTIEIRAATISSSRRSELASINPGGDGNAARINDKTVELARFATDFGLAVYGTGNAGSTTGVIYFKDWRCSGSSVCVVKHEDPARPCNLGRIDYRGINNVYFDSLRTNTARRFNLTSVGESAWRVLTTTAAYPTAGLKFLDTYNAPGIDGDLFDSGLNPNGVTFSVGTSGVSAEIEFNNFEIYGVCKAFLWGADATKHYEITWNGRTVVRYYSISAVSVSQHDATSFFRFDWLIGMSPVRDRGSPWTHADTIQVNKGVTVHELLLNKFWVIQADGTGRSTQAYFANALGTVAAPVHVTINQAVICDNVTAGIQINNATAALPASVKNFTMIRQMSGPWGLNKADQAAIAPSPPPASSGSSLDAPALYWPRLNMREWIEDPSAVTIERGFSYADIENAGGVTLPNSVYDNDKNPDLSAWFPAASWICNPDLEVLLDANAEVSNYLDVDDVRWHGTVDEVLLAVRTALTPTVDGPAILADGRVIGAFFPDGTDNDGSVFGTPAPAPTAYTLSSVASATVGDVVPFTATLNQPALVATTITFSPTGVAGTLSSPTAIIPIGQTSASVTFTPSAAGPLAMAVSDNRGLPDPGASVVSVTAPEAPSLYTLSAAGFVAVDQVATVTAVLNRAATQAVTISLSAVGLSGAFSAGQIVIGVGQTMGSVTFTPSAVGAGTISSSNNRGLPDPDPVSMVVTSRGSTRGSLRRLLGVNV